MKSGYKILWTDHAISELKETIKYLENNWTEKEIRKFAAKLDHTVELISKMPEIFPESFEKKNPLLARAPRSCSPTLSATIPHATTLKIRSTTYRKVWGKVVD